MSIELDYSPASKIETTEYTDTDGIFSQSFDAIELKRQTISSWLPYNAPKGMIKKILSEALTDKILYDVHIKEASNGVKMLLASTSIYLKPDNIEMNESINALTKKISAIQGIHKIEISILGSELGKYRGEIEGLENTINELGYQDKQLKIHLRRAVDLAFEHLKSSLMTIHSFFIQF